jgi:translocation and assembly module TamB
MRQEAYMGRKGMIALLCLVVVVAAAGAFWLNCSRKVMAELETTLAAQMTMALGSKVTIAGMEIDSLNQLLLHNVVIYDKEQKKVLSVKRAAIWVNPLRLLLGKSALGTVSSVRMTQPELWLNQKTDGQWNVEELLTGQNHAPTGFSGEVIIEKGQAWIQTHNRQWAFEKMAGTLDFSSQPSIGLDLRAFYKGKEITVKGVQNSRGRTGLAVTAQEIPVADWQAFCPKGSALSLRGGNVKNLSLSYVQNAQGRQWAGQAELDGLAVDLKGMAVRAVKGYTTFTNHNVYLFVSGLWQNQPLALRGSVQIGLGMPVLSLEVQSAAFDPLVLDRNLPVRGLTSFDLQVSGLVNAPAFDGQVRLPQGTITNYPVKRVKADIHMADGILAVRHLSADIFGGQITAAGNLVLSGQKYHINLSGRRLDMAALAAWIPQVKGRGDFDIAAEGRGTAMPEDMQGTAAISQGSVADIPFDKFSVGFVKQQDHWAVHYANLAIGKGMLTLAGNMTDGKVSAAFYGTQFPLAIIGQKYPSLKLAGTGRISGSVAGTLASPVISGQFTAENGEIYDQPFAQAQGAFQVTKEQVELKDFLLQDGATSHQINGTIGLQGKRLMHVSVISKHARAENIVKLLSPGEALTGNVDNEMLITGPMDDFQLDGHMRLTAGSFRGQLISKAWGSYQRRHGRITLDDFRIVSLNTYIHLSGIVEPDQNMNLNVAAEHINLARLNLHLPYPAAGHAKFVGKLTGTPQFPVFNGNLTADSLLINGQEFTQVRGQVQLNGPQLDIPDFHFHHGQGICTFAGGINLTTQEISGALDVQNLALQSVLATFNIPDKEIRGNLSGQIRLGGTAKKPNLWVDGNLTQGAIKNYPLDSIRVNAALENGVFKIYELSAKQGQGVLKAQGTADLNGKVDMEVGGRDINAGLISAWFDLPVATKGQLQFTAQITGRTQKPHAAVSLEVDHGGIANATFDSLYGLFVVEKDNIQVNQVLLIKGPYRASAYGNIPVAALSAAGRRQVSAAQQMNLKVNLDEADLSILPVLTKEVSWAAGHTQGTLILSGTLADPLLNGNIRVQGGTIKLASLYEPIQKVNADIRFNGNQAEVKQFDGSLGSGSYSLTGNASWDMLKLSDYHFALKLQRPDIRSKYFTGPLEGKLLLMKKGDQPQLSGNLLLQKDTIDIPGIPELGSSTWNALLDVDVHLGNKVRFYNPFLYDLSAVGHVHFGGSVQRPNTSGGITATRGTLNYLGTQFKVQEGHAGFTQYDSFVPVLHLAAQTALQQTTVNLVIEGPATGMKFHLTSDPEMSQQQILSLLTLRSRYYDAQNGGNAALGKAEISSMLGAGLQARFLSALEANLQNALGLDEFHVVRDTYNAAMPNASSSSDVFATTDREVYNLEIGKYVTDKLMVGYTVGIDYKKNEYNVRYDLSRRFSLSGSVDDQHNTWLGLEARFRF